MRAVERSSLLAGLDGVRHGFSTRRGGVSTGPFESLNLGRGLGDADANVDANLMVVRASLGLPDELPLVLMSQVHGARVVPVDGPRPATEADGIVTWTPQVAIAVRTADCAPVLIAHARDGRADAVAAVHAGWRGAVAGILGEAVRALESLGARREALFFALGPTIGPDAFEVGDEVVEAARGSLQRHAPPVRPGPRGRAHLDLRGLLERQLDELGVDPARVERVGGCTHDDPERYFSHRRTGGRTGRHLSLIVLGDG
jgi:YfiH family protein